MSKYSVRYYSMNRRDIQKRLTRHRIIAAAKEEFIRNGFLSTNTKTIADKVGIAHGTLFLHFETKFALIEKVLESQLEEMDEQLSRALGTQNNLDSLLHAYLELIQKEESFYEVMAKELPYYPQDLRIRVFMKEASARDYFYDVMQKGIDEGVYKNIDIRMALTFLFGTIHYFLSNKQNIIKNGSIMAYKKHDIMDTFLNFIKA